MLTRVIVNGASGKMGVLAAAAIESHPDFQLVGRLGRNDSLEAAIASLRPQVVVDLTRADCVYENSLTIIKQGAHPVIGSSGLMDEQIQQLTQLCDERHLGGIIVPNFSIAACLMMRFSAEAASFFPDAEIIEAHHAEKCDAPSGTALKTAEMMANGRTSPKKIRLQRELIPGALGASHHEIPIHSIRLPGILARQQVIFGGLGETLTLTHESIDRASFMPGVLLACQRVHELTTLHYGLEHLLFH